MGQKNCSIKNEDELAQIIGNYRVTSDFEWLEFKAGIDNHIEKSVFKDENSNSLDSFDDRSTVTDNAIDSENEVTIEIEIPHLTFKEEMNQDSVGNSAGNVDTESLLSCPLESDETSSIMQYNCSEMVEETEALVTDSITESVDIRISPRNSTIELINFQAADPFPTEFSLVADVEIKMESTEEEKIISTVETSLKNSRVSNDITHEAILINLEEDCANVLDEKPIYEKQNQINISSVKLSNCDVLEQKFHQSNDKILVSERSNGPKTCTNTVRREVRNVENGSAFTVESKIAQEIKEMKQREEDLRKMRDILAKEMSKKPATATTLSKSVPEPEKATAETAIIEKEKTSTLKPQVVSGNQIFNIACVFGHKRKDTSKNKDSTPKVDKKPIATSTYESPIEREIRIVKQREEELKREREQALKIKMQLESCELNPDLSDDDKETIDTFASVSICSDSSFDSGTKLTTPDQKHFDGTLSPTTMNNKINALYFNSSNAESVCSLDSISQSEKSNSINGFQKVFTQHTVLKDSSPHSNSLRSPSPDSSSSSSISKLSFPFSAQKSGLAVQNKNVNMERFIASKGKQIVFKNASPISAVGSSEYFEIKPPQVKKRDQLSQRKFLSAASKIQTELQEMKEREEELRKERVQLLGSNGEISDLTPKKKDLNQNTNSSTDICSSPDFLENSEEISSEIEKKEVMVNQGRRRSTLIEDWERRIKKLGVQV